MENIICLTISALGFIYNGFTLLYIFHFFNIRRHVFLLLFIDNFFSSLCCLICFIIDLLAFTKTIEWSFFFCNILFLTLYLPINFGAITMMLISALRYSLALKSSKNIHPSTARVSAVVIVIFFFLSTCTCLIFAFAIVQDLPFSFFVEDCASRDRSKRIVSVCSKFLLSVPNLYTVILLITDVKMLLFLKKAILPERQHDNLINEGKIFFLTISCSLTTGTFNIK